MTWNLYKRKQKNSGDTLRKINPVRLMSRVYDGRPHNNLYIGADWLKMYGFSETKYVEFLFDEDKKVVALSFLERPTPDSFKMTGKNFSTRTISGTGPIERIIAFGYPTETVLPLTQFGNENIWIIGKETKEENNA